MTTMASTPKMHQSNRNLLDIDRDHLIHSVTSFRAHEARGATMLQSGKGMWLTDMDGREVLDAFAGLWCVNGMGIVALSIALRSSSRLA